jgi:hypothetical protein
VSNSLVVVHCDEVPGLLMRAGFPWAIVDGWPPFEADQFGREEYLYIARGPEMTLKIGYSTNPSRRIRQLSTNGEHRLLVVMPRGNRKRENRLLALLQHERVMGEWFRGPDSELLLAMIAAHGLAASKSEAA